MSLGILGKKVGMTRVFDAEAGCMIPVTVVDVNGNEFLQVKTSEKDGYSAIQVAYDDQKESRLNLPERTHQAKQGATGAKKRVQEFRFLCDENLPNKEEGHPGAALFEVGQWVDVIGVTKGKGFQGHVKRHNHNGQPDGHGHMMHRRTGAIGAGSTPARVWKGQKMPGHDGVVNRTTQNLKIVQVRPEDGVLLISGAVPGHNGAYVTVRPALKKSAAK
jgi:large subunit ribosomal protein L3